ncbi:MAG: alpha-galactosidase, partial [Chloroflexi bacterium]|nr:alpha-galactosidase [Chloroflexota bacterium]
MLVHLRADGMSLVLDARGGRLPRVVHWGSDLELLSEAELSELELAQTPARSSGVPDQRIRLGILPEHGQGWPGQPGLRGHREGSAWSPLFTVTDIAREDDEQGTQGLRIDAHDAEAELGFRLEIDLLPSGVLRLRSIVRNHGDSGYTLDGLVLALPVPRRATELLDLTGRHLRERSPQRQTFDIGARVRDSWRGRTGLDATLLLTAGTPGFGFRSGEVWGIHVAWSGNHRTYAERLPSGERVLAGGELLLPGEVRLESGEEYVSPSIWASYGEGLDGMSSRMHSALRARASHPRTARPVILNTWEAVYFDHDYGKLAALAEAAATVGVERFVLDDGWFIGRRHDRAGLG